MTTEMKEAYFEWSTGHQPDTNGEIGPRCSADPAHNRTMTETTHRQNTADTTDASTDDLPDAIEGPYAPRGIDGGVVIEAQAYTRTRDGNALRFDGSTPVFVVGLCSEIEVREALSEYSRAEIDRAIENGTRFGREKPANANEAIAAAESPEVACDDGTEPDAAGVTSEVSERIAAMNAENERLADVIEQATGERPIKARRQTIRGGVEAKFPAISGPLKETLDDAFGVRTTQTGRHREERGDDATVTTYQVAVLEPDEFGEGGR